MPTARRECRQKEGLGAQEGGFWGGVAEKGDRRTSLGRCTDAWLHSKQSVSAFEPQLSARGELQLHHRPPSAPPPELLVILRRLLRLLLPANGHSPCRRDVFLQAHASWGVACRLSPPAACLGAGGRACLLACLLPLAVASRQWSVTAAEAIKRATTTCCTRCSTVRSTSYSSRSIVEKKGRDK